MLPERRKKRVRFVFRTGVDENEGVLFVQEKRVGNAEENLVRAGTDFLYGG
jgi:hypothetical protein